MANPIDMNTLLNDLEKDLKKSIDAQVSGMPDSLDEAIGTAQLSRTLNAQSQKISKGTLAGGGLTGTTIDSIYWDEISGGKNIAQEQMDRQKWLKETEHNRLIAYTEANRLAVEVFKATFTPGGLVETTEEIIKSAAMIAAFLNEGKVK